MSYGTISAGGEDRVNQLRSQVDTVKGVLRENINKVAERGEKLEDLGERAEYLNLKADIFQHTATRLKRKLWWQNMKLRLIFISIIVVIVIVIILIIGIVVATKT